MSVPRPPAAGWEISRGSAPGGAAEAHEDDCVAEPLLEVSAQPVDSEPRREPIKDWRFVDTYELRRDCHAAPQTDRPSSSSGEARLCDCKNRLEMRCGSLLTMLRVLDLLRSRGSWSSSLSECFSSVSRGPPRTSISWRTAMSHEIMESGLSKTRRKLRARRRAFERLNPKREKRLVRGPRGADELPPDAELWETCSTQCLPGIASLAKATD